MTGYWGAVGLFGGVVELDEGDLATHHNAGKNPVTADGAGRMAVGGKIPGRRGAFGSAVKFGDGGNSEAGLEAFPDIRAEAIPEGDTHVVLGVEGTGSRGEKIAERLAHVLNDGALVVANFGPEGLGAEAVANHDCAATTKAGPYTKSSSRSVVYGHALVDMLVGTLYDEEYTDSVESVCRLHTHPSVDEASTQNDLAPAYNRRLWQPGCAACVYENGKVRDERSGAVSVGRTVRLPIQNAGLHRLVVKHNL